ncbi:MAG: hypothetical protein ABI608_00510 [Rhizomicrobium sp.]
MSSLDLLKTVAIALVMAVVGVTAFVHLKPFDPVWRFACIVALGVVALAAAPVFFYAALKSKTGS